MKFRLALAIALMFVFAGSAGLAAAQEATKPTHAKTRTLTGCVQKGDDADEFNFTAKNGSTWELESDTVKLADHVGHTVTITGAVKDPKLHAMKEDMKEGAKKVGVAKDAKEHGRLAVTHLKMVSDSCQK